MSQNKTFAEKMSAGVANFVENHEWNNTTKHATLDASKVELPENVTVESINTHIAAFNTLAAQAEVAGAEIARQRFAEDDKLTTVDASLVLGDFQVNTQHHLSQKAGEDTLFGLSTTTVDYVYNQETTDWLDKQRESNQQLAQDLFK